MAKKLPSKKITDGSIPETKNQRFVRLANSRVGRAVKMIFNIGNLGGPGYESTPEQREKISAALNDAVKGTLARLNKEETKSKGFTL